MEKRSEEQHKEATELRRGVCGGLLNEEEGPRAATHDCSLRLCVQPMRRAIVRDGFGCKGLMTELERDAVHGRALEKRVGRYLVARRVARRGGRCIVHEQVELGNDRVH